MTDTTHDGVREYRLVHVPAAPKGGAAVRTDSAGNTFGYKVVTVRAATASGALKADPRRGRMMTPVELADWRAGR